MYSRLAENARREFLEAMQRLTPEQRLNACLSHSRFLVQLHQAGEKLRKARGRERAR
jgi:hypothetical protein